MRLVVSGPTVTVLGNIPGGNIENLDQIKNCLDVLYAVEIKPLLHLAALSDILA